MKKRMLCVLLLILLILTACGPKQPQYSESVKEIPDYSNEAYFVLNNNVPEFSDSDIVSTAYEYYSELDALGRCGYAMACVGPETMPTEERGAIGQVKPSGWQTVKYDFVDGKYLYNRCHLIGFQLTGENANVRNLITGTRYMNVQGMLPFENMVADYIKETGNHVLYRVTPIFDGEDLVARGVQMEALSVEDQGDGISFNVYVYNTQPGVTIDYATGMSSADSETDDGVSEKYILNTNTRKFHQTDCKNAETIKEENREEYIGTRDILIAQGYAPCGACNP